VTNSCSSSHSGTEHQLLQREDDHQQDAGRRTPVSRLIKGGHEPTYWRRHRSRAHEDNTLYGAGGALCGHDVNGINYDVAFKLLFIKFFMYVCQ
jgi:hypothetical protein